ncbi:MAG: hypothetical protein QOE76_3342, partial [Frankiales bacterium]|nr:hypothetical protein [Frankiales bacterium]
MGGLHRLRSLLTSALVGGFVLAAVPAAHASAATSVSMTGITDGASVGGMISMTGAGIIDPSQTAYSLELDYLVDGVTDIYEDCPDKSTVDASCQISLAWDTTGWPAGPH